MQRVLGEACVGLSTSMDSAKPKIAPIDIHVNSARKTTTPSDRTRNWDVSLKVHLPKLTDKEASIPAELVSQASRVLILLHKYIDTISSNLVTCKPTVEICSDIDCPFLKFKSIHNGVFISNYQVFETFGDLISKRAKTELSLLSYLYYSHVFTDVVTSSQLLAIKSEVDAVLQTVQHRSRYLAAANILRQHGFINMAVQIPISSLVPDWPQVAKLDRFYSSVSLFSWLGQSFGWPETYCYSVSDLEGFSKFSPFIEDKTPSRQVRFLADWLKNDPGFIDIDLNADRKIFTWCFAVPKGEDNFRGIIPCIANKLKLKNFSFNSEVQWNLPTISDVLDFYFQRRNNRDIIMRKEDLRNSFRRMPTDPVFFETQFCRVRGVASESLNISKAMGDREAPVCQQLASTAYAENFILANPDSHFHAFYIYEDDFYWFESVSDPQANFATACSSYGLSIAEGKSQISSSNSVMDFLGWSININSSRVGVSSKRMSKIASCLTSLTSKKVWTATDIRSAHGLCVGILIHKGVLVTSSRLNRWRSALRKIPSKMSLRYPWQNLRQKITLSDTEKSLLIQDFVEITCLDHQPIYLAVSAGVQMVHFSGFCFTDASKDRIGGYFSSVQNTTNFDPDKMCAAFSIEWPSELLDLDINPKELAASMLLILYLVRTLDLSSVKLCIGSDNLSTVHSLAKRSASSALLASMCRSFFTILDFRNIVLECNHVPGAVNLISDNFSRDAGFDGMAIDFPDLFIPPSISRAILDYLLYDTSFYLGDCDRDNFSMFERFRNRLRSDHDSCNCSFGEGHTSKSFRLSRFLDPKVVKSGHFTNFVKAYDSIRAGINFSYKNFFDQTTELSLCWLHRSFDVANKISRIKCSSNKAIPLV